jgi:hypothetical protein
MALVYTKTFSVKVEVDGGDFELVFKRTPLNKLLATNQEIASIEDDIERTKAMYSRILENAVDVKGFTDEDGQPIPVEEIKALGIDLDLATAIIKAFNKTTGIDGGDPEKKSSASEQGKA